MEPKQRLLPGVRVYEAHAIPPGLNLVGKPVATPVLARDAQVPLESVTVTARGTIDRERQPHTGVTVFTEVEITLRLRGPSPAQAEELVAGFQRRCPVYGSLAVASGHLKVRHQTEPRAGSG